jgi:hypothetical protein
MIGFIIGTFVGGFIGVTFMALCVAGSKEPPAPSPTQGQMVYIASPYKGDMKRNLRKAAKYTAAEIKQGKIPIAPHLFYSAVLDDTNARERQTGMSIGIDLLTLCNELWAFGTPSEGMAKEIEIAKQLNIPVIYHSEAGGRKEEL